MDGAGNLLIADTDNHRVRKVSHTGIITTVAGIGGRQGGYAGDGGPATNARLNYPFSIALDGAGNIFIADTGNEAVRKVSPSGTITTVASGPATGVQLDNPFGVAVDGMGNVLVTEFGNHRIRKVSPSGVITTVTGNGTAAYSGDGGVATNAELAYPFGLAVDGTGRVFIADSGNNAVRLLTPTVSLTAIQNAASYASGPISPGEIVILYGSGMGPAQLAQLPAVLFGTTLAGTQVLFNGIAAPLISTSASQVAAIVPYEVSGASASVQVSYQGQLSNTITVQFAASAPGVFSADASGKGQAAAINQDGFTPNSAANPAKVGDVISLYITGEGQTTPAGVDGKPAGLSLPHPNLPVSVTIGGQTVTPLYAGGAPGEVAGVMQVNVQIPSGIQTGDAVGVVATVGNASSQPGVTIAVR